MTNGTFVVLFYKFCQFFDRVCEAFVRRIPFIACVYRKTMEGFVEFRARVPRKLRSDFIKIIQTKYGMKNVMSHVVKEILERYIDENMAYLDRKVTFPSYAPTTRLEDLPKYELAINFIYYCGLVGHDESVMEAVFKDNYPQLAEHLEKMIPRAGCKIEDGKVRMKNFVAKAVT